MREDIQAPSPPQDKPRKGFYQTRMLRVLKDQQEFGEEVRRKWRPQEEGAG